MDSRTRVVLLLLVAVAAATFAVAGADFERIAALDGEWALVGEDGKPGEEVFSIWRVTAAGTAVIETMRPGSDHEMVTMYHPSGDKLALTHYCALGNQPRMEAAADGGTIDFTCSGGDNIPDESTPHMHAMSLQFVDENRVIATWTHRSGEDEQDMMFEMVRKSAGRAAAD